MEESELEVGIKADQDRAAGRKRASYGIADSAPPSGPATPGHQGTDDQTENEAWTQRVEGSLHIIRRAPEVYQIGDVAEGPRDSAGEHAERAQRYRIRSIFGHVHEPPEPYGTPMMSAGQYVTRRSTAKRTATKGMALRVIAASDFSNR